MMSDERPGPEKGGETPEGNSAPQGGPKAYSSYELAQAPRKPSNLFFWIALVVAAGFAFKHFTMTPATTTHVTAEVATLPAQGAAVNLTTEMISDLNRYMDVAETSAHPGMDAAGKVNPVHTGSSPDLALSPEAKQAEAKLTDSVVKFGAADATFVALLSKCYIDGHDVHFITPDGKILNHVSTGSPLAPLLTRAREVILLNPGAGLRVLVFKDKIQVVGNDGKLLNEEQTPKGK